MQRAVTKVVVIAVPAKVCSGLTLYFVISFFKVTNCSYIMRRIDQIVPLGNLISALL